MYLSEQAGAVVHHGSRERTAEGAGEPLGDGPRGPGGARSAGVLELSMSTTILRTLK